MSFWKNKILASLAIAGMVTVLAGVSALWNPLESFHLGLSNFLYTRHEPSSDITIIAIDEKSLDAQTGLGPLQNWPRSYYAQLLEKLAPLKPAVVGFDVSFGGYSKGMSDLRLRQITGVPGLTQLSVYSLNDFLADGKHPDDVYFQNMLKDIPAVLWVDAEVFSQNGAFVYRNEKTPVFSGEKIEHGMGKLLPDKDNVARRTFLWLAKEDGSEELPALALQAAKKLKFDIPDYRGFIGKPVLVNFAERVNGYRKISFLDILTGKFRPEDIQGKIVLVGATAGILHDNYTVPNSRALMPGVEVQANVAQQLLEGRFLAEHGVIGQILMLAALALLAVFAMNFIPILWSVAVFFIFALLYSAAAKIFFDRGLVLNLIYPYFALLAVFFGSIIYRYFTELREKRMVKAAFSHYVNKEVVAEVLKHPEMLKLGGEKRRVSVLFSDIISFTSLAEKLPAEETVSLLNEYLDAMTAAIFAKGGTLDKFEGDAIMAFFGAPLPNPDHAKIACEAALEMRRILAPLHEKWHRQNKPILDFCVGISTGEVVVGNLGSKDRFDYTVIGDTVNLGARLESINRLYGTKIIVDESTMQAASSLGSFRKLDRVRVKGKQTPTVIYELFVNAVPQPFTQDFESGMKLYEDRHFSEAKKYFESALKIIPADGPAQIYKNRCEYLVKSPPPQDWDLVVELDKK